MDEASRLSRKIEAAAARRIAVLTRLDQLPGHQEYIGKHSFRPYGLAVGMRVVEKASPGITIGPATVIALYAGDRNRVRVRLDGGGEMDFIAEWCEQV